MSIKASFNSFFRRELRTNYLTYGFRNKRHQAMLEESVLKCKNMIAYSEQ